MSIPIVLRIFTHTRRLESKGITILVEKRVAREFPQFEVFDPCRNGPSGSKTISLTRSICRRILVCLCLSQNQQLPNFVARRSPFLIVEVSVLRGKIRRLVAGPVSFSPLCVFRQSGFGRSDNKCKGCLPFFIMMRNLLHCPKASLMPI